MSPAVVLGGGFAGVLTASVLARHFPSVTIVEAATYPDGPAERSGVPQAHHNHVLVAGGARALETLAPGIGDELLALGAHRRDMPGDSLILSAQGWFRRQESGAYLISCSRWLLDFALRRRLLGDGTIAVRAGTRAVGLTGSPSGVTGVELAGSGTLPAALVVDATGRRSRAPQWLAALGLPPVPEEVVDPGVAYSTRVYRAPARLREGLPAVMVHPRSDGHGGTVFPIEDGRWIVTLTGTRRNPPPVDPALFAACARGLPSPVVSRLIDAAAPAGGVRPFRANANRRRYFGAIPGFLAVGDALTTMNPIYSHGMSVAALAAVRLDQALAAREDDLQAAMAAVAETPWRMATARDAGTGRRVPARLHPALVSQMCRAQALIEPGAPTMPAPGAAPADTAAAVAQFPELADWWAAA